MNSVRRSGAVSGAAQQGAMINSLRRRVGSNIFLNRGKAART
jgi:hypothetical protein